MITSIVRHRVVKKYSCSRCGRFFGLITSDGCKPFFDACKRKRCPAERDLPMLPTFASGAGGGFGGKGLDEDAGGYQAIARRAMEDGPG